MRAVCTQSAEIVKQFVSSKLSRILQWCLCKKYMYFYVKEPLTCLKKCGRMKPDKPEAMWDSGTRKLQKSDVQPETDNLSDRQPFNDSVSGAQIWGEGVVPKKWGFTCSKSAQPWNWTQRREATWQVTSLSVKRWSTWHALAHNGIHAIVCCSQFLSLIVCQCHNLTKSVMPIQVIAALKQAPFLYSFRYRNRVWVDARDNLKR